MSTASPRPGAHPRGASTARLRGAFGILLAGALALAPAVALPASAAPHTPVAAAASASPSAPTARTSTLRIATAGFVDSFNPFTSVYLLPTNTLRYMYENLVQYDATDGSPTEGLAKSWETSADGLTWTYTMQDGLTWSDGEPITANDVKWTYEQMMTVPDMGTANGGLVANFASVEAPDDATLVITLKEAQAANPGVEIPIVPEHVWSKISDPATFANDSNVVGSGPFLLESYAANQSISLKANPKFWRGAPKIDGIQYIYYTNSDAQLQALRAGEVDMVTGLTPTQFQALQGAEGITTNAGDGRRFFSISINPGAQTPEGVAYGTGNPALGDAAVRGALRQAIDIPTLLTQVLGGEGTLATSFIPAVYDKWSLPADDSVIQGYDPDAAAKALDAAGWVAGADGIRAKDGKRLSLRLLADADSTTETSIADFLVPWFAKIGVELKTEQTDSDTIDSRTKAGDYDLYFSGWSLNPDPDYQLGINLCSSRPQADGTGGTSQDLYCNPKFDALYAQQHTELDEQKRQDLVREMLRLNYTDAAQIDLWYAKQLEAYRSDRFTGFTTQPTENGIIANQVGYWGYLTVAPVGGAAGADAGNLTWLWITIGVVVVVAIVVIIVVVSRRRTAGDRE